MNTIMVRFTPSLMAVKAWLRRLFGRKETADVDDSAPSAGPAPSEPATEPPAPILLLPPPVTPPLQLEKRRAPRRSKTQVRPDAETFAELLEGLDDSFSTMQIPAIKGNWLPKADIIALHKIGLYIPTPWLLEHTQTPTLPIGTPLPMIASCLITPSKYDGDDRVHPRFAFAIKAPRLPVGVEHISGTPYRFGYCVQLHALEHDKASPPRMFWVWAWMVVRPDGSLVAPNELRPVVASIKHRRSQTGQKARGSRSSSFTQRQWRRPTAFVHDKLDQRESYETFLLCVFRQLLLWWNSRDERWSVGVRKNGKRVTFSIAPEHTAAYFADREKTVTVSGATKKIIHFVREHTRVNGSTVKEHVRGLRLFDWRGFQCSVTAPKLNGAIVTVNSIDPVECPSEELTPGTLSTQEACIALADAEDFGLSRSEMRLLEARP